MSKEDVELERWKREWQELGGRDGLAKELAERVVKDGRRLRRGAAVEILATVFSTLVCLWFLARSRGELVTVVVCAAVLIFNGVWVTRLLTLRQGSLRAAGTELDAFLELTRRRLADDLKWNAFGRRSTAVGALFLAPWSVWMFASHYDKYMAEPWRAVVGFGGIAVILSGLFAYQSRKRRALEADRDRLEALVAERTIA